MSEKKELNAQDLEKVSGGGGLGYASAEHLPKDHGLHISAHEAINYKDKEVYFVRDSNEEIYGYGTLTNSVPVAGLDCYTHYIMILYSSNWDNYRKNAVVEFNSNKWTLYKKNN